MGFWDSVGSLINAAEQQYGKLCDEIESLQEKYRDDREYSDRRLIELAKMGLLKEQTAARMILKERGYSGD